MVRVCFLACWILTFSTVALQSTRYALPGQMVFFDPAIETPSNEILWKHNGNKVVEFNGKKETVHSPFEKRITLDWNVAVLEIEQLSHSDSGDYELDVITEKGFSRFFFKLEVIDRVAKPTIFCKMNNGSSSSDKSGNEATLTCSADSEQSQLLTFEWSRCGKPHPGPTLKILLGEEHDDEVHRCTVSNRLSNETAKFTAKDCYLVNSSDGLSAGVNAAIAIIVLLCVLGILGAVYCKLKHKACFAKEKTNDGERQSSLGEANDPASEPLLDRKPTLPSNQRLHPLPGMTGNKNCNQNHEGDTESDEAIGPGFVKRKIAIFEKNQQPAENEDAPNMAPADEHTEAQQNGIADQVTTEPKEENEKEKEGNKSNDLGEKIKSSTTDEQTDLEISKAVQTKSRPPVAKKPSFSGDFLPNKSKKKEDKDAPNMAPADENKEAQQNAITNQVTARSEEEKEENKSNHLGEKIKSSTTDEQTEKEEAPNMAPADEHKEEQQDIIGHQVTVETKKEDEIKSHDWRGNKKSSTTDEQTGYVKRQVEIIKQQQAESKKQEDEDIWP